MKRKIRPVVILLLFFPLLALALPDEGSEPAAPPRAPSETFDFVFKGGTLADLLRELREQTTIPQPQVVGEGARHVQVPPLEIYSVQTSQVYEMLQHLLSWRGGNIMIVESQGVWIVDAAEERPDLRRSFSTTVYQIGAHLERFRLDDLTTAIETAWEMADLPGRGRLRFHEETKVLFVSGTYEHLNLVDSVLIAISRAGARRTIEGENDGAARSDNLN